MTDREILRILCVFGTRPGAIKMAPVIWELQKYPDRFSVRICVTAQHRDMLDQMLRVFDIVPDVDLNLMQKTQTPIQVASRVLAELEPVLEIERPDWVLTQGDTTSLMATAIATYYQHIRLGHIEAGCRTGDHWNPFPEEMNRIVADHLSDLCFAPTELARQNLLQEGISDRCIQVTGNTGIDALYWAAAQPCSPELNRLQHLELGQKRLILVTAHRRESFGPPLEHVCRAVREIAQRGGERVSIIYAVHPNPAIRKTVYHFLDGIYNVNLMPPLNYVTWVHLMKQSAIILTDSGGIQTEAPNFGIPVLVMREKTEMSETVRAGAARLVGTDIKRIVTETMRLLDDTDAYANMARPVHLYGDGNAAARIVEGLWMTA